MIMKSARNYIPLVKRREKKGEAWLFGIIAMVFVLILGIYCMETIKAFTVDENVRDLISASGLGSLVYDTREFSITGDLVLNDENGNVDNNFLKLCQLLGYNLNLQQKNTTEYIGTSPFFNADGTNCYLKQAKFYNKRSDGVTVYTYNHAADGSYTMTTETIAAGVIVIAPEGSRIDTTSVYISFCYPQDKIQRYSPNDKPDELKSIITHNVVVGLENYEP